jgi:ribosomal-protein-serine acetyltransferase
VLHKHRLEEIAEQFRTVESERDRLIPWIPSIEKTLTEADARRNLETALADWEAGALFDYTLKNHQGQFLGRIGMYRIDKSVPRGEIGYWLRASAEGKGYVVEGARALEQAAWKAGFHRLEVRCDPRNLRSHATAKRLGFTLEGTLRENLRLNNELVDTMVWAKLRSERQG